jgi:hypothetical protein
MGWLQHINDLLEAEHFHPTQLLCLTQGSITIETYAPVWDKVAHIMFGDVALIDRHFKIFYHVCSGKLQKNAKKESHW